MAAFVAHLMEAHVSIAHKIKVMVVDDQVTSRLLLTETLQSLGFKHISVAKDGEDAFGQLIKEPHHLVISDFNMPKMDGLGLLQAVRTNASTKKSAFIILTAQGDRPLGANNVLAKPFTTDKIKSAIEAVFGAL